MHRSIALLSFTAALLVAPLSSAVPAPRPHIPATASGPRLPEQTPLRVTREDLTFDCDRDGEVVVCKFSARYQLVNPTAETQATVAAFYGIAARDVTVRVDGVSRARALTTTEAEELDRKALLSEVEREKLRRIGFDLSVPPNGKSELAVEGVLVDEQSGTPRGGYGGVADAIDARHLLFHTAHEGRTWRFQYLLAPLGSWSGAPTVTVEIRYPKGLARALGPYAEGDTRFRESVEGDQEVVAGTFVEESLPGTMQFGFHQPAPLIRHGGPLIAIGAAGDGERTTRLRLGWEVAAPRWLLYSANVDLDFRGRVIAAPVVHAATPWLVILPSLGVGAGVPVQIRPDVRAGVRFQFDAMLAMFGFLASVDIFPAVGAQPEIVETALMFKVSL